jgi:hypothetical protein
MNDLPRSTDTEAIAELEVLVETLGLDPMDQIGDLVHDVADRYGTEAANSAASEDQADEIIDTWSQLGSDANNNGLADQLAVLIAFHGPLAARQLIEEIG